MNNMISHQISKKCAFTDVFLKRLQTYLNCMDEQSKIIQTDYVKNDVP